MTLVAWTQDLEAIATRCVGSYFLPGGDHADLVQEARVGVWKAAQTYDHARGGGDDFNAFAYMCGSRAVITAVRNATRLKHRHLNAATSLDAPRGAGEGTVTIGDLIAAPASDPLEHVLALEDLAELGGRLATLTPLEREAFVRVEVGGEAYDDLAELGGRKVIDNALQRARHKLRHGHGHARGCPAPAGRPPAPSDARRCSDCHRPWIDTNPDRAGACPFCGGPACQPGMMPRDGRPHRTAAPRGAAA